MDLKHCPQRDVESISKKKMFTSTVSKYDPRTGRVTKLQFCVPYTVATDNGGKCKPPVPKCYYYDYRHNTVCSYDRFVNNTCF
jgi:hypothetical protein